MGFRKITSRQIPAYAKKRKTSGGFTLIELIVVLVLLSIMFTFALPKMDGFLFSSDTDRVSKWIFLNVASLKSKAVKDQVVYSLNADTDENSFFISTEEMDEEMLDEARKNSFKLPEDVRIIDIVFPFEISEEDEESTGILFYTKGYSDNAIIHVENSNGEKISYIIEPFLPSVDIREGFFLFDEG